MKTLSIIILFAFSSFLLTGQNANIPQMEIKNLEGATFISTDIIDPASSTLVVLWGHIKSTDQYDLERIQSAWVKNLKPQGVKMVVICAGNIMSKNQLKELAKERSWEFEIFFDYYGEFMRGTNVTNLPGIIYSGNNHVRICHNHINCAGKINLICENILENLKNTPQLTVRVYDSTKKHNQIPPSCNSRLW
jgi:hypothetical protein